MPVSSFLNNNDVIAQTCTNHIALYHNKPMYLTISSNKESLHLKLDSL
jgi:hypothetical protein